MSQPEHTGTTPALSKDLAELVDDALAKISDLGTVGAMKWLAKSVSDRSVTAHGEPAEREQEPDLSQKKNNDRLQRAHTLLLELLKQAGVGDGTRGWIEHDDGKRGLVRDALSFEGELVFGFEAILDRINSLPPAESKTIAQRDPEEPLIDGYPLWSGLPKANES